MINNKSFKYLPVLIPLAIILSFLIDYKRESASIIDWPNVYGLFYPMFSDAIGHSFNIEYYCKGLILNFILFFLISYPVVIYLNRIIHKQWIKISLISMIWLIFSAIIIFKTIFISYVDFKWDYDKTSIFK